MHFFPWGYNQMYGNFPYNQYNNSFFGRNAMMNDYNAYNNAIQDMVQRNIDAEKNNSMQLNISDDMKIKICDKLKEFIKNEKDSFLFYEYLRGICSDEKCRKILKKISEDCENTKCIYVSFYEKISEKDYINEKSCVDEAVNIIDGVLWAIEVESASIFEVSDFIAEFDISDKKIVFIPQKKCARIGFFYFIYSVIKNC